MYQKDMSVCDLIDTYGNLLSEHKLELISLYYNEDYSLSEIAENCGLSRQGVRDSIRKSESELRSFEEKLHLVSKIKDIESVLDDICSFLSQDPTEASAALINRIDSLNL